MLKLAPATDRSSAQRVLPDLDEILVDHAHLGKKAAGNREITLHEARVLAQAPAAPRLHDAGASREPEAHA